MTKEVNFICRHIGPQLDDLHSMLSFLGHSSIEAFIKSVVPKQVATNRSFSLDGPYSEDIALKNLSEIAKTNQLYKSWIGCGFANCITPAVIVRHMFENPGWYTPYTPYQAELAQGRLQSLFNFQTMICDLTGLEVTNASLLDEPTSCVEAMMLANGVKNTDGSKAFFIAKDCHPQIISVVKTRCFALGLNLIVGDPQHFQFDHAVFGVLVPYPNTYGQICDYRKFIDTSHQNGALAIMTCDLLSLALLKSPGELGADIAVGSAQRFGCPVGYGGPHAGFIATKEMYKRKIPGRIVGVSKDVEGNKVYRLALQTREQHIRREKATSNICTAQALLANVSAMYAVYHGPQGIKQIAERIHEQAKILSESANNLGYTLLTREFFDTVSLGSDAATLGKIKRICQASHINLRYVDEGSFSVSFDETTTKDDLQQLIKLLAEAKEQAFKEPLTQTKDVIPENLRRTSKFLLDPVFNQFHSEVEFSRYLKKLELKDVALTTSMIPLGSCTMKLNAACEMMPIVWPEFNQMHPFVPLEQAQGYQQIIKDLESMLLEVTGFSGISLQPNSGAQGEYAGLLLIKKYHMSRGQGHRNVCLIPSSAHGTNPASAAVAGYKVVVIKCDKSGNIDIDHLRAAAMQYRESLAALMITYPSTHGVFEENVKDVCQIIHDHGGQVYLDGANFNAQIGLCSPEELGADVCHLNLHKTFCIPHGGGGPGAGPIAVSEHLEPFLPEHSLVDLGHKESVGSVAGAPWGSASLYPICWMYFKTMGMEGLKKASMVAILNANYIAKRLEKHYPVLYKGKNGYVAHECIIDIRPIKQATGISVHDVSKRLMDYGFHAPTVSWPVVETMMIEPTESESKVEIDRFCDAMISIRKEIKEIEDGKADRKNNVLKGAPHTAANIAKDSWDRPYTREQAVYPVQSIYESKYWPPVGRIDEAYGDRNFCCKWE